MVAPSMLILRLPFPTFKSSVFPRLQTIPIDVSHLKCLPKTKLSSASRSSQFTAETIIYASSAYCRVSNEIDLYMVVHDIYDTDSNMWSARGWLSHSLNRLPGPINTDTLKSPAHTDRQPLICCRLEFQRHT